MKSSHNRTLALIAALCVTTPALAEDFESFTPGSVNSQGGWTVEDEFGFGRGDIGQTPFDESVVDDGTGNMVWRFSNAVTSTSFSNHPYSQTTAPAGEAGSALWNDRGSDHTSPLSPANPGPPVTTTLFHSSFSFRSATGAAQGGLQMDISPSAKQSAFRNGFVRLLDDGTDGIDVFFYETGIGSDPFGTGIYFPEAASNLAYDQWHTIDIFIEFVDGLEGDTTGNDKVHVLVNGTLAATGSSWESYYAGSNPGGLDLADQPHRQAVDSLIFRPGGSGDHADNGFYFDNVIVDNAAIPEPTSLALLGLGGLIAMRRRRVNG